MFIWRCEICGDPYLGEYKPSDCPFCGAPGKFIALQREYKNQTGPVTSLSDISRNNLEAALQLEVHATEIYKAAAENAKDEEAKIFFKAIAKHESEHISLICKALGIAKPAGGSHNSASGDEKENMLETARLEDNATKLYARFLSEATEERVKDIFVALIEVERAHYGKANQLLAKL